MQMRDVSVERTTRNEIQLYKRRGTFICDSRHVGRDALARMMRVSMTGKGIESLTTQPFETPFPASGRIVQFPHKQPKKWPNSMVSVQVVS